MSRICDTCLHHIVCARQCKPAAEHGCSYFMGWVPVEESLPPMKVFPLASLGYGQKRSERVVTVDSHWDFPRVQSAIEGRFPVTATHWLKGLVFPRGKKR